MTIRLTLISIFLLALVPVTFAQQSPRSQRNLQVIVSYLPTQDEIFREHITIDFPNPLKAKGSNSYFEYFMVRDSGKISGTVKSDLMKSLVAISAEKVNALFIENDSVTIYFKDPMPGPAQLATYLNRMLGIIQYHVDTESKLRISGAIPGIVITSLQSGQMMLAPKKQLISRVRIVAGPIRQL